jgi:hypothetical protein
MYASNSAFRPSHIRAEGDAVAACWRAEPDRATGILNEATRTNTPTAMFSLVEYFFNCIAILSAFLTARGAHPRSLSLGGYGPRSGRGRLRCPCLYLLPFTFYLLPFYAPEIQSDFVAMRADELVDGVCRPVTPHAERVRHDAGAGLELLSQHRPQPLI